MVEPPATSLRNELWPGTLLCAALCALGLLAWWSLPLWARLDLQPFTNHAIFYYLFARNEPVALLLSAAAIGVLAVLGARARSTELDRLLQVPPRTLGRILGLGCSRSRSPATSR